MRRAIDTLRTHGLYVSIYRGAEWHVTDPRAPHAAWEAGAVQLPPAVVPGCNGLLDPVITIVGVSNDHASAKGEKASRRAPWLVTGGHDELVNTTETGQRVRQHRRVR